MIKSIIFSAPHIENQNCDFVVPIFRNSDQWSGEIPDMEGSSVINTSTSTSSSLILILEVRITFIMIQSWNEIVSGSWLGLTTVKCQQANVSVPHWVSFISQRESVTSIMLVTNCGFISQILIILYTMTFIYCCFCLQITLSASKFTFPSEILI